MRDLSERGGLVSELIEYLFLSLGVVGGGASEAEAGPVEEAVEEEPRARGEKREEP